MSDFHFHTLPSLYISPGSSCGSPSPGAEGSQTNPISTPFCSSPQDFRFAAKELQKTELDCDHWTFGGLKRGEDGSFDDAQLAQILMEA